MWSLLLSSAILQLHWICQSLVIRVTYVLIFYHILNVCFAYALLRKYFNSAISNSLFVWSNMLLGCLHRLGKNSTLKQLVNWSSIQCKACLSIAKSILKIIERTPGSFSNIMFDIALTMVDGMAYHGVWHIWVKTKSTVESNQRHYFIFLEKNDNFTLKRQSKTNSAMWLTWVRWAIVIPTSCVSSLLLQIRVFAGNRKET